jgi:hypothetical protein
MGLLRGLVQVPFEGVQALAPQRPIGLQPPVDLGQGLRAQRVEASLGVAPDPDEPRVPQHPQVLGHAGLAEPEAGHQLVHRPLALAQQVEDVAAVRLGEHLEGGHRRPL